MDARTKWPGGALARTDRAGTELQVGGPAFRADMHPTQRGMQAATLCRRHRLSRERASLIAELHFGDMRE